MDHRTAPPLVGEDTPVSVGENADELELDLDDEELDEEEDEDDDEEPDASES